MNFLQGSSKNLRPKALTLLGAALLSGCGPGAASLSILPASQSTFQGSTANNKVDMLWVIDTSGSMFTKQQLLASGFNSFANVFTTKGFNFNMAIVTADTYAPGHVPIGGQAGVFQGTPTVINTNTTNFATTFQANVQFPVAGNSDAKKLDAIELALSPSLLAGSNSGFLRSDAHLAVILVSDDDDYDSTATVSSVKTFLNNLKPDRFDVITRTYKKNYTVSAVIMDTLTAGNSTCPMPANNGLKAKQLALDTNGSVASICEADFSAGLTTLSQRIAEAITEIPLARTPDISTISVYFNGAPVAKNSTNGWSYSATGNKIVFHGNSIPTDNTSISIGYTPSDIIR